MLTLKLPIKSCNNTKLVTQYQKQYTGMFHKLYNNAELLKDKDFRASLLQQFPLFDVSMLDFCIDDVLGHLKKRDQSKKDNLADIVRIEKILNTNNFKTTK